MAPKEIKMQFVYFVAVLLCLLEKGWAVTCYECNVWKAGYGHLCDNPLVRDDCLLCMKTETTVFMGYYKNTPRTSSIISRVCAKSKTVSFGDECHYYPMAAGVSVQCYCNSDKCNGTVELQRPKSSLILSVTFILAISRVITH